MSKILPLLVLALATACSPRVRTNLINKTKISNQNSTAKVVIYELKDVVPVTAEKLGSVKVTDGGFTLVCDYKTVLAKAEMEAIKAGGNALKITKHTLPGILSTCHQLEADIYDVDGGIIENRITTINNKIDSLPQINKEGAKSPVAIPYHKYRISFSGGPSFLLGKVNESVPNEYRNYISELKSGSHFSIDGGYFFEESVGFGLKYSSYFSKNSASNLTVTDFNGQVRTGVISDNINTQFIGPVLYYRGYSKSRNTIWFLNASLGYLSYNNKSKVINDILITGSTFSTALDFAVDFKLGENLYFGLGTGLTAGALRKIKYESGSIQQTRELNEGEYESMNRIDLSAGLKLAF